MQSWLWISIAAVFGMGVAIGSLLLRGLAAWLQKRWKPGVDRVAYAIGWLVLALVTISVVSTRVAASYAPKGSGPEEKAYLLADTISEHMNAGFLGVLFGVTLGALLEWRARRANAT